MTTSTTNRMCMCNSAAIGLDGELLEGRLPEKQYRIVSGWIALHEEELYLQWNNAVRNKPLAKIEPLK